MKLSKNRIAALVSVAAVAAFALVFAVAAPQTASAHGGPGGFSRGGTKAPRMAGPSQDTYLADALGITAEELQAAQRQAVEAGIDQAVEDGLITEAQAELIKEHGSRFMGMIGKFGRFGGSAATIDHQALLADALGISVEELQDAQAEAKDAALAQAIEDGKITQEQVDRMNTMQALRDYLQEQGLQDNIRSLYSDALQDAVDAGVITQEQADQLLEGKAGFGMRGFGKRGGGMRGSGGMRGFAPGGDTETAPTAFRF